jgi:hypothetical protein
MVLEARKSNINVSASGEELSSSPSDLSNAYHESQTL